MGLFFDKVRVALNFIFWHTVCLFILPLAITASLINRLVNGHWNRDGWMNVYEAWKESWITTIDFLVL